MTSFTSYGLSASLNCFLATKYFIYQREKKGKQFREAITVQGLHFILYRRRIHGDLLQVRAQGNVTVMSSKGKNSTFA